MEESPITPHAGPIIDLDGNLTYIGDDGRRYVVGPVPEGDEASVDRVMELLRSGNGLFNSIEALSRRWLETVSGTHLERRAALVLLLTTLETALEDGEEEFSEGP
ncbi:MAG: hypothetical protein RLZZ374_1577 [Cyanobacteriota bacterium]|nr:hypothetical protein [Synechococcales cyanobacterium SupBloom_Metag_052]